MFKEKIRVSSGVSQLDRQLGGLFIGDNVVWYDDAGSLASIFSLNFILFKTCKLLQTHIKNCSSLNL